MKTKFGAIIVDGRGKIGGHVMTKNRQGSAMRTKVTPTNRSSNTQQAIKSRLSGFSKAWRGLTDAQRSAWNSAAPDFQRHNIFGDSYSPTGFNLYQIINQNLAVIGVAAVSSPPVSTAPTPLTALSSLALTAAAMTSTFAPTPVAANNKLVVEATRPLSAGKGTAKSEFRTVQVFAAAQATPADTFASYSAKFGAPVVGKRIFVRAYTIHSVSGIRSLPFQYDAVAA